jgi:hypothetical protein
MLDGEAALQQFASQRLRIAEVLVELINRRAVRVVRVIGFYISINSDGRVDRDAFMRSGGHMIAAADERRHRDKDDTVIEASSSFLGAGARWTPSAKEMAQLSDIALRRISARRLAP